MTTPPGHDLSLATLAVQVSNLRRDLDELATELGALATAQQEHTTAQQETADLRDKLDRILAFLDKDDEANPSEWFWLTMTDQQRNERLAELSDWVETVLRPQYPGYLTGQIRLCWPSHPEARWELTWLYQLWTSAFLTRRSAPKDAADWHDRWYPGVIHRLAQVMRQCKETCQRQLGHEAPADTDPLRRERQ